MTKRVPCEHFITAAAALTTRGGWSVPVNLSPPASVNPALSSDLIITSSARRVAWLWPLWLPSVLGRPLSDRLGLSLCERDDGIKSRHPSLSGSFRAWPSGETLPSLLAVYYVHPGRQTRTTPFFPPPPPNPPLSAPPPPRV